METERTKYITLYDFMLTVIPLEYRRQRNNPHSIGYERLLLALFTVGEVLGKDKFTVMNEAENKLEALMFAVS